MTGAQSGTPEGVPPSTGSDGVRRVVRRSGFFALSFGSIVGSGWIILLGEWLQRAGPGGALLALLSGGTLMAVIGTCYAELAARMPRVGGEFLYTLEGLGRRPGFVTGWFMTLFLVAICAIEGTALPWLLTTLFPPLQGHVLYSSFGTPVTVGGLVSGLLGTGIVCALNLSGVRSSVLFQRLVTYGFLAVMVALIVAGVVFGSSRNLHPLFASATGGTWLRGSLWIFATCAMLLNGFQAALYVIEERAPEVDVRTATVYMVLGIGAAAAFYAAVVVAASSIVPWRSILGAPVPAVAAFDGLSASGLVGKVILCVAIASLAKTWNAVVLMASRLILAQARAGFLPAPFGRLDPRTGAPGNAIWLITACSVVGVLLGSGAIVPIVNMATTCTSLILVLCLAVLLKLRRRERASPGFAVPGGTRTVVVCMAGAILMAGFALSQPLLAHPHEIPLEWLLIATWAALGVVFSGRRLSRAGAEVV